MDQQEIFTLLTEAGYILFNEDRNRTSNYVEIKVNNFCLHNEKHKKLIGSIVN